MVRDALIPPVVPLDSARGGGGGRFFAGKVASFPDTPGTRMGTLSGWHPGYRVWVSQGKVFSLLSRCPDLGGGWFPDLRASLFRLLGGVPRGFWSCRCTLSLFIFE